MTARRQVVLVALALASCSSPVVRLPQLEQATQAAEGGGDRYRAHRACTGTARSVDELLACMKEAGWTFVARGQGYPETGCWQARDQGRVDDILPLCFVRSTP
jgi:hypothetical protein